MKQQRPNLAASYGVSSAKTGMIPWSDTRQRLIVSRNYWIATADAQGLPHSSPIWGVWLDDHLYFGTDQGSQKATNIAANPRAVVHLESGDDVVIVHCGIETTEDAATVDRVLQLYRDKYSLPSDFTFAPVFVATPHHGFAWTETEFPSTATKYVAS